MAPRSKRQRHLRKLVDSQERYADGRFREEVVYLRESNVGTKSNLIGDTTSDGNSKVDIDDNDFYGSIQVDDSTWTVLPGCDDGFEEEELHATELDHDLNYCEISSSLLTCL
jgi:hypothetical protein